MQREHPARPPVNIAEVFAATEAQRASRERSIYLNDTVAVAFVAMTVVIFNFSFLIPVVPILLFYALWFPQPLLKGREALQFSSSTIWVLAIPVLAILSTFWSDYPSKSLYLGAAMLSTVLGILILNRVVRFRALLDGLVIGTALVLLITLLSHRYGLDTMSGTYSLMGYFHSKNIVGEIATVGVLASVVGCFMPGGWLRRLVLYIGPFILGALCLVLSKSATSCLSLLIALLVIGWCVAVSRLPHTLRHLSILATLLAIFLLGGVGVAVKGSDAFLKTFGKDTTLTGRTYLWQQGYQVGMERPILGHGYSAFWVKGQPQAERYWHEFFITDNNGFHFHNMLVQALVDLGLIGAAVIALQMMVACFGALRMGLSASSGEAIFWVGLMSMFIIRAAVEVDFLHPFNFGTLMVYSALIRLAQWKHVEKQGVQGASVHQGVS